MESTSITSGPREWTDSAEKFLTVDRRFMTKALAESKRAETDEYNDFLYRVHRIQGFLDDAAEGY